MHKIDLPVLRGNKTACYRYLVGNHSVGIISPTRKKHLATIEKVKSMWTGAPVVPDILYGQYDRRITPEEVANYILLMRLA
jgi:hypothetical protein